MASSLADWRTRKADEERQLLVRFDGLDALALRLERYQRRAEASADALAGMANGDAAARRREARDLERAAQLVRFYAERLDRVHLIEEPARHVRKAFRPRIAS